MKSLSELYCIGRGPSSSHTMGPAKAAELFKSENPDADFFKVTLFGSLALTGKGHSTDVAVRDALAPVRCEILFDTEQHDDLPHPNTLDFEAFKGEKQSSYMRVASVGGGAIKVIGRPDIDTPEVYPEKSFSEIAELCKEHNLRLPDYVEMREGSGIWKYLEDVWSNMRRCIEDGLCASGELPGGLGVERKAQYLFNQRHIDESDSTRENRLVCAYAFAASEQNASAGQIVTAPTCGSCGVVPAALYYMKNKRGFSDEQVVRALAVGGVIGNLIKTNATISGAECGCQAEIGSACSMAAAALGELFEMGIDQIEYAAEVAMEHHLGLTCDPIDGLVQIPCIERNAVAAMRAINALSLANFLSTTRKISFDMVVETMYETGRDLSKCYRETGQGGLAKLYK
ncbi:MAG: serine dehydratase [Clostridiales bacterium]|nr:serine dehydratase [Clostridiales bacterium]